MTLLLSCFMTVTSVMAMHHAHCVSRTRLHANCHKDATAFGTPDIANRQSRAADC
jgi:hypothetical protein